QHYSDLVPPRPRGVSRSSQNAGRDAVDAAAPFDERCGWVRSSRVVLTPRRWCQVCDKKRRRRWQESPVHRGEHEVSRKTIARGMPGETGVTVVTMLVFFFYLHTRLRAH